MAKVYFVFSCTTLDQLKSRRLPLGAALRNVFVWRMSGPLLEMLQPVAFKSRIHGAPIAAWNFPILILNQDEWDLFIIVMELRG